MHLTIPRSPCSPRPGTPRNPRGPRLTVPWLVVALLSLAAPAAAHPVPFSYLDVRLDSSGRAPVVGGSLTVHVFDAAHELSMDAPERLLDPASASERAAALERVLESRLTLTADGRPLTLVWGPIEALPGKQSLRLQFTGSDEGQTGVKPGSNRGQTRVRPLLDSGSQAPGVITVSAALFPYDANHQTFVNIYEGGRLRRQAMLDARHPSLEYFSGSVQGTRAVVTRFVSAGIHHILIGPDHLLFLVGLLLLGGSIKRLLLVVTSFTVAHSLTLTIAALNLFSPPVRVVEPLIALSIIYVGCDNLLIRGGRDVRAWIAFSFGLVHGFGFASVLREMDLPSRALGWSLFSFNLGVEIGQLAVVVLVASALAALRHRSEAAGRRLAFAGSLVVVIAGTFWFVQRVFFAGGSL